MTPKKTSGKPKGDTGAGGASVVPRAALFVLLAFGASAILMSRIEDLELLDVAPYFLVAIAIQLVPFVVRPSPDPFEPAGVSSVLNLLALVPSLISYVVNGSVTLALLPHVTGRARVELVQTVMIAYIIGTLAYLFGYYQGFGKRLARVYPDVAGGDWKRSRVLLVFAGCFALFIPAYAYFQARVGGSITDITTLGAGKEVFRDDATKTWIARAVGIGFIPPLIYVALSFPKFRWRRGLVAAGLLFVIAFLATRLGSRGTAVFCILNALIIVHYLGRRIPMWLLAAIAFFMLVVTNVLGEYRSGGAQQTASAPGPQANFNAKETLVQHDDDRLRIAALAVVFDHFPDKKDYLLGESWGPVLTAFIPQWLWPEKKQAWIWRDTGIVINIIGAPVPVPYLGLLYCNFSWVGIVFGMAIWGAFQRGMYEWLRKNDKDKSVVLLYACLVVYLGPTMLQLSATIGYVLPVWAAIRVMRGKLRRLKAAPPALPAPAAALPAPAAALPGSAATLSGPVATLSAPSAELKEATRS